jgi:ATP-binding cassette subfamily C protein LapB
MKLGESTASLHRIWMRPDVMAASLGINVLALALPIAILQMYDRVIRHQSMSTLIVLTAMTLAAFALEFSLRSLRAWIMAQESARYDHRENCRMLARLLAADIDSVRKETPGTHADRFHAIQTVRAFYCQAAALITDIPFIIVFVVLIAVIAGWMAVVPVALLLIFGSLGITITRRLTVETARRELTDIKRQNFLVECIGGITTIKSLAAEDLMQRRHERIAEEAADAVGATARVNAQTQSIASELAQAASIITVVIGAIAVVNGALTIGGLAATTLLTGRLLQPVLKGLSILSRYPFIRLAEEKMRRMDELVPQLKGTQLISKHPQSGLKLEGVSFGYANGDKTVLDDISLEIPPGRYIAITGQDSSGRSTLLKLMNGLLTPSAGSIRYDNVPICLYDGIRLRRHIALIPIMPTIYAGTLLENLTVFETGDVQRRALALCRVLGLTDYVASLSRGLETQLSGVGDMPMGIAQRISIVRSLAQNPRVVLFDTANASLDHDADRMLLAFFASQKGKRAAVFVTDRPSYLALCDTVYEIIDGKLRERSVDNAQHLMAG